MLRVNMFIPYFWLTLLNLIVVMATTSPRLINVPRDHMIINTGEDLKLRCESPKEITWSYPVQEGGPVPSFIIQPNTFEYPFLSTLTINNASYLDTGFYYCLINGTSIEQVQENAKIYVYVKDPVNLLAKVETFIIGHENKPVTLPCRPTSPDVEISLNNDYDELISEETVTFSPQLGFTIANVNQEHGMSYRCQASKGSLTQNIIIYLHILPASDTVEAPEIFLDLENDEKEVSVGSTFKLTCTVAIKLDIKFKLAWSLPEGVSHESIHIKIHNTTIMSNVENEEIRATSQIQILSATKADLGRYVCTVRDHNNNVNSAEIRLDLPLTNNAKESMIIATNSAVTLQYSTSTFIVFIFHIFCISNNLIHYY